MTDSECQEVPMMASNAMFRRWRRARLFLAPDRRRSEAPADVVDAVRDACRRLGDVTSIEHVLPVFLLPGSSLQFDDDGRSGFGAFLANDSRCEIWLPAFLPDLVLAVEGDAATRPYAIGALVETLAHEVAHYEQWRDNRPVIERGIAVRTRTLMRAIGFVPVQPVDFSSSP